MNAALRVTGRRSVTRARERRANTAGMAGKHSVPGHRTATRVLVTRPAPSKLFVPGDRTAATYRQSEFDRLIHPLKGGA